MWFRPVHEKIVRERLDGAIRLLRGETAGYSLGRRGERSLLKKLRKTFIRGIWISFVQVRVLPNMVPSVPYVDRSRAAAGASAFYGERVRDIVSGNEGNGGTVAFEKAPQNFYEGDVDMDIVCASPIASQCGSVRSLRRSFASG